MSAKESNQELGKDIDNFDSIVALGAQLEYQKNASKAELNSLREILNNESTALLKLHQQNIDKIIARFRDLDSSSIQGLYMSLKKLREAPAQCIERFSEAIKEEHKAGSQPLEDLLNTSETDLLLQEIQACEKAIDRLKKEILNAEQERCGAASGVKPFIHIFIPYEGAYGQMHVPPIGPSTATAHPHIDPNQITLCTPEEALS
ncbi:hypothetical protein K493DRAFT_344354 [Basidiobolus meristosporus CBS 931.73]|uniref:Uncharacterized protein n=1 Tax=Basidiobolus meristosporus CBS 931.73 TaxID=1314790 RepID=A0A1Y1Z8X9_9FUNG|nr:hypothetical protein K493DRAFT_344354 [Basidiobolus meristosporus CBS 931.73]|eukprot:ORY06708.1 hypothetical protein K493DRAFT_344354 [Basidiobolus meristosporus CBS 931.73]